MDNSDGINVKNSLYREPIMAESNNHNNKDSFEGLRSLLRNKGEECKKDIKWNLESNGGQSFFKSSQNMGKNIKVSDNAGKNKMIDDNGIWSQMNQESCKQKKEESLKPKKNKEQEKDKTAKYDNDNMISDQVLKERQKRYQKSQQDITINGIAKLQRELIEQNKRETQQKEELLKRKEIEKQLQVKRDKEMMEKRKAMMKGERERLEALYAESNIDVGEHAEQQNAFISLEAQKRFRNYDYLLGKILNHRFGSAVTNNPTVPDMFRSTSDYQNVFCVLCSMEC